MAVNSIKGTLVGFRINVKGYNETYNQKAFATVTFNVILENGIPKDLYTEFSSSKGKVTPEQKYQAISELLYSYAEEGTKLKIKEKIKQNPYEFKFYSSYDVDTKDKVYLAVDYILNGNR